MARQGHGWQRRVAALQKSSSGFKASGVDGADAPATRARRQHA